jgi:PAS domain S-box-containing protein
MIILDMHTVIVLCVISYLVCTLFVAQLWQQNHRRFAGIGFWALNFALQSTALVLLTLRDFIPDWMSIVLANTLIFSGTILNYIGLERFVGKPSAQLHNYVLLGLFAATFVFLTHIHPDLQLRTLVVSAGLLIIAVQSTWLMWHRVDPAMRRLTFGVGMVFAGYCAVSILRIAGYFFEEHAGNDFLLSGPFQALVLVSYQNLLILLTYSLVLMVNRRLMTQIGTQEEKFAKAFHSAPYSITLTRLPDGTIVDVNQTFCSVMGYARTEVIGKKTMDLNIWACQADRAAVIEALSTKGKVQGMELRFRKRNGESITGLLSAEIILIDGEKRVLSCIGDITDMKRAKQALVAAKDEAERANRAKSQFLASMSHELRTPMNSILGFTHVLESNLQPKLDRDQQEMFGSVQKAGRHLLELINDVLDLEKVESGGMDLSMEPVGLPSVLRECIDFVRSQAAARQIGVSLDETSCAGLAVFADRTRLRQALLNLLSNAVKYNVAQGRVEVGCTLTEGARVRISVKDNGPGLTPEQQAHLYETFNRLGREGSAELGTGVGLALTRRVVELMGGRIGVDSAPGQGSTFWLEFSLKRISAAPDAPEGLVLGDQAQVPARHTVLYVEDNEDSILLVAHILGREKGLHVLTAHTGELGLEAALVEQPDLIILDIQLPGMDGYEVLRRLRENPLTRDIPAIAFSADALPEHVKRGITAGFADYLTKPLQVDEFVRAVHGTLKTRTGIRRNDQPEDLGQTPQSRAKSGSSVI